MGSEVEKLTQMNIVEDEQGGSVLMTVGVPANEHLEIPQPDFDIFTNLDSRINDYQITKEGNGTI